MFQVFYNSRIKQKVSAQQPSPTLEAGHRPAQDQLLILHHFHGSVFWTGVKFDV